MRKLLAKLEGRLQAAVGKAIAEGKVPQAIIVRAGRLAARGKVDVAMGLLAGAVREHLDAALRAAMDETLYRFGVQAGVGSLKDAGLTVPASKVRRRMQVWARRRSGRLITNIGDSQAEAFRRMYSARLAAARAGKVGVLDPRALTRDVARLGFGLDRRRAAGMADAWIRGESEKQLERRYKRAVRQRSFVIARTESSMAGNGALSESWRAAGVDAKKWRRRWILTDDERLCDICEPLDGATATLDGVFPGGFSGPPAHPQCRCTVGLVKVGAPVRKQL